MRIIIIHVHSVGFIYWPDLQVDVRIPSPLGADHIVGSPTCPRLPSLTSTCQFWGKVGGGGQTPFNSTLWYSMVHVHVYCTFVHVYIYNHTLYLTTSCEWEQRQVYEQGNCVCFIYIIARLYMYASFMYMCMYGYIPLYMRLHESLYLSSRLIMICRNWGE